MRKGSGHWSEPFLMADTPGFPDCNSCMVVDPKKHLWLFWPIILDNHWESAITKYKVSAEYQKPGAPKWIEEKDLFLKPGPEFQETVERDLEKQWDPFAQAAIRAGDEEMLIKFLAHLHEISKNKLPFIFERSPGKFRLIVPLYSDAFDFSLMAITDDWGANWTVSAPLVGPGNVQPSIVQRRNGNLVAYFRDNGPPPQRVMVSESNDQGMTWSLAKDIDLPNPGSGLEAIVLKSGSVTIPSAGGTAWRFRFPRMKDAPGP
jgi:hypothetical protein